MRSGCRAPCRTSPARRCSKRKARPGGEASELLVTVHHTHTWKGDWFDPNARQLVEHQLPSAVLFGQIESSTDGMPLVLRDSENIQLAFRNTCRRRRGRSLRLRFLFDVDHHGFPRHRVELRLVTGERRLEGEPDRHGHATEVLAKWPRGAKTA